MARSALQPLCGSLRSVPFMLYRSGTSRGPYLLESDVPPAGPDRDSLLCKMMGSGHPQMLEGFGGGCGPTSKAVVVGRGKEVNAVTFQFAQCRVEETSVDHSHGDCGNMLAAVAPFALERGLAQVAVGSTSTRVNIHSLVTGALYAADVLTNVDDIGQASVCYEGEYVVANVPSSAAPVVLTTYGIAGSQTGKLLPTGAATDAFELGDKGPVSVTAVDFARALLILDADEVLPHFGYASIAEATKDRLEQDTVLCKALEGLRLQASLKIGMGDCTGKDAPKVALVAPYESADSEAAAITCRYFVNPGRNEVHPSIAMTAAQALGAACLLKGSVAQRALRTTPTMKKSASGLEVSCSFQIAHVQGLFPLAVGARPASSTEVPSGVTDVEDLEALFPFGVPESGKYTTTVLPIAEGRTFV